VCAFCYWLFPNNPFTILTHTHTHTHAHSHSLAAQEKLEEDAVILIKDIEGERKEYETKIKSLDRKERDLASQVCL
jgi:hypothetical protein